MFEMETGVTSLEMAPEIVNSNSCEKPSKTWLSRLIAKNKSNMHLLQVKGMLKRCFCGYLESISTARLNLSLSLHLQPINLVISQEE